jgi:hypothetical protein
LRHRYWARTTLRLVRFSIPLRARPQPASNRFALRLRNRGRGLTVHRGLHRPGPAHDHRAEINPGPYLLQPIQNRLQLGTRQHAGQPVVASPPDQVVRSQEHLVARDDKDMVEIHIGQRPDPQGGDALNRGMTFDARPVQETYLAGTSLQDKEVITVKDSQDQATLMPVGGGSVQIGVK